MIDKEMLTKKILELRTLEDAFNILRNLRIACANEKSNILVDLIDNMIQKSDVFDNKRLLCFFYDLKIRQMYSSKRNLPLINPLILKMQNIAYNNNYYDVQALTKQLQWHIEKLVGNKKNSSIYIRQAMQILKTQEIKDEYVIHGCKYSFALEMWSESRDFRSAKILEECLEYFLSNRFYHGIIMSFGILIIIYQQTQNKDESIKLIKRILCNKDSYLKMPKEIKSIVHFFIGFVHILNFNLNEAENHLLESQNILKHTYKTSIYSGYYLTTLSHLTSTYALQGKLRLALDQIKRVKELLEEEIALKNLDSFNKNQIIYSFNLTKFYIQSRLSNFCVEKLQDLIETILSNVDTYHSNAIMLSEFILNANLTKTELQNMRKLDNSSTRRIEHILDFLIFQDDNDDKQTLQRINTLKRRPVEERMTYVERAFADLLAAQEYYKINRFLEIQSLLKNYQNHLHSIEVLELRVFMEAFIQVGAFKSGDPLGPALQYMAIKKCRNYGFSRLENRLLNYLDMQSKNIQSLV